MTVIDATQARYIVEFVVLFLLSSALDALGFVDVEYVVVFVLKQPVLQIEVEPIPAQLADCLCVLGLHGFACLNFVHLPLVQLVLLPLQHRSHPFLTLAHRKYLSVKVAVSPDQIRRQVRLQVEAATADTRLELRTQGLRQLFLPLFFILFLFQLLFRLAPATLHLNFRSPLFLSLGGLRLLRG